MKKENFSYRSIMSAPAEEVFRWHTREGAFERLTPPWEPVKVVERHGGIQDGGRVVLNIPMGPFRQRWISEHYDYQAGRHFRDRQIKGPFASMEHLHKMEKINDSSSYLEDSIDYTLPFGALGQWIAGRYVQNRFARLFEYRHLVMAQDLMSHQLSWMRGTMKIAITGASGLIGTELIPFLTTGGHTVIRMVRHKAKPGEIEWYPDAGIIDRNALEGLDAVIHLAGDNIAEGSWTPEKKARIRESRVKSTRLLCETLAQLDNPPKVLICGSAIGYYGDRGDEILREESPGAQDFLGQVCHEWEDITEIAEKSGIRVVNLRIGVVLTPKGGALGKMLLPFKLGMGGRLGSGEQYMSWVAIDDVIGIIHYALVKDDIAGPLNVVSPNPVTNLEFTKTLGKVLVRPTIFPVPAAVLRLLFGEIADALLLASTRVHPGRLLANNYQFRFPELETAFRHVLGK